MRHPLRFVTLSIYLSLTKLRGIWDDILTQWIYTYIVYPQKTRRSQPTMWMACIYLCLKHQVVSTSVELANRLLDKTKPLRIISIATLSYVNGLWVRMCHNNKKGQIFGHGIKCVAMTPLQSNRCIIYCMHKLYQRHMVQYTLVISGWTLFYVGEYTLNIVGWWDSRVFDWHKRRSLAMDRLQQS